MSAAATDNALSAVPGPATTYGPAPELPAETTGKIPDWATASRANAIGSSAVPHELPSDMLSTFGRSAPVMAIAWSSAARMTVSLVPPSQPNTLYM
ncbi:unannotated protein [freshwater metagenome]|uniref:Unannotated protein n=1 Tax=freshwater metagenome TaxID=449393 RepID=A0A6J7ARF3_9ZZZZ